MAEDTNQEGGIAKYIQSYMWVMGEMHNEQVMHFVDFIFFSTFCCHYRVQAYHIAGYPYSTVANSMPCGSHDLWLLDVKLSQGGPDYCCDFFLLFMVMFFMIPNILFFFTLNSCLILIPVFTLTLPFVIKMTSFFFNKPYLVCDYFSFLEF